jgi:MauM/NapG family ferredoxin protein
MVSDSWFHPALVLFIVGLATSGVVWRRWSLQRASQVFFTTVFISLLWLAAFTGRPDWPVDAFFKTDPLLVFTTALATRVLIDGLWVAFGFVVLAAVMGRVFCSHICPLGTLIDVSDKLIGRRHKAVANHTSYRSIRNVKNVILVMVVVAAGAGFNLLGLCDPLAIITRFSAMIFYPFVMIFQDISLTVLRPMADWVGWTEFSYLELILPSFAGTLVMTMLLAGLLALSLLTPRFWCRSLCPLGALLGWLGQFAPYRRRVNDVCSGCDRCVRECPVGAIHQDGVCYDKRECIVCLRCTRSCPEKTVSFSFGRKDKTQEVGGPVLGRRTFLGGITGGIAVGLGMHADLLHPGEAFTPLPLRHPLLIRPPGALPEPEFLSRCVRCGECLRACLTNTLQPDWYRAGLEGLWAPRMHLRHAACEQTCNVCGQVCPTGAIRNLNLVEKQYAKVGTAVLFRDRCLAWAQNKRCQICDEQCPYNAIVTIRESQHTVGVPVVIPDKCNGCGQCEYKCPMLGESAIIVSPHGELRLTEGSYMAMAKELGLVFEAKQTMHDQIWDEPPTKEPIAPNEAAPPAGSKGGSKLPPGIIPQ